ncbi:hypothetical protein BUALT_Bualt05G0039700 [Buddleja alternifolia]|uniref:ATP-dependent RNA helicase n=1 Tax=Buddleja alternifolia TaxID=168488 RepID=A0AAV6XPB3_9LAMI|nr:hypothetical protein BUALT_Bualt05G0039700 [Buddleja alternifolia]
MDKNPYLSPEGIEPNLSLGGNGLHDFTGYIEANDIQDFRGGLFHGHEEAENADFNGGQCNLGNLSVLENVQTAVNNANTSLHPPQLTPEQITQLLSLLNQKPSTSSSDSQQHLAGPFAEDSFGPCKTGGSDQQDTPSKGKQVASSSDKQPSNVSGRSGPRIKIIQPGDKTINRSSIPVFERVPSTRSVPDPTTADPIDIVGDAEAERGPAMGTRFSSPRFNVSRPPLAESSRRLKRRVEESPVEYDPVLSGSDSLSYEVISKMEALLLNDYGEYGVADRNEPEGDSLPAMVCLHQLALSSSSFRNERVSLESEFNEYRQSVAEERAAYASIEDELIVARRSLTEERENNNVVITNLKKEKGQLEADAGKYVDRIQLLQKERERAYGDGRIAGQREYPLSDDYQDALAKSAKSEFDMRTLESYASAPLLRESFSADEPDVDPIEFPEFATLAPDYIPPTNPDAQSHVEPNVEVEEVAENPNLIKIVLLNVNTICFEGFEKPTEIQKRGTVPFLKGLDVIQQARSGTGKTTTLFSGILQQLDYTMVECQALVLTPTPELARHIEKVMRSLGVHLHVKVHTCVGGTSVLEDDQTILSAGVHVVVGTPGQVFDLLKRQSLRPDNIKMFVLDEADGMLSRGFKDQIHDIFQLFPRKIQVGVFSATMPPEALEMTRKFMNKPVHILVKDCKAFKDKIEEITESQGKDCGESEEGATTASNLIEKLSVAEKDKEEKKDDNEKLEIKI